MRCRSHAPSVHRGFGVGVVIIGLPGFGVGVVVIDLPDCSGDGDGTGRPKESVCA